MAVAAYEYTATPYVVRFYNRAAMDVATRTSEAAVFTAGTRSPFRPSLPRTSTGIRHAES